MFDTSVIKKTKQLWKLGIGAVILMMAVGVMLYGFSNLNELKANEFMALFLGAISLSVVVFVWQAIAIRCPVCGMRWFWASVKEQNQANWLVWLLKQPECPKCKSEKL